MNRYNVFEILCFFNKIVCGLVLAANYDDKLIETLLLSYLTSMPTIICHVYENYV
jgi:hypothetical protein